MRKINLIKMILDIVMTLVLVLLYNKRVISGLAFHEMAGLCIGGVFIIHKALNWRWIKQVTLNITKKKISLRTKICYAVDVLLLCSFTYIIVSGILISKTLFPNINVGNESFFSITHKPVAYAALILIGIHIGFHWSWVINIFKKIFGISNSKKISSFVAKVLMLVVLSSGIYSIYSTNFFGRFAMIGSAINGTNKPGIERGLNNNQLNRDNGQFENKNNINITPQNGNNGMGNFPGHGGQMPGGGNGFGNVSALSVIRTYLSIVGFFAIVTFYIEKLFIRLRTNRKCLYQN
ncbi:DUF4405 domain-containing protein [Caloramator sp. E03]|uniref:DUF4405 domain-containing protein n=1 Tax=Caloramator sp. E03 TaxID=2576307 RepID=UPI00111020A7|nr:DUF4405 domain-containing protein [Caloramator sp. E03]QCX32909.1 DUF4405 domain-containing protein [Caloramator sp. E03]